jgi:hypothetical protein
MDSKSAYFELPVVLTIIFVMVILPMGISWLCVSSMSPAFEGPDKDNALGMMFGGIFLLCSMTFLPIVLGIWNFANSIKEKHIVVVDDATNPYFIEDSS